MSRWHWWLGAASLVAAATAAASGARAGATAPSPTAGSAVTSVSPPASPAPLPPPPPRASSSVPATVPAPAATDVRLAPSADGWLGAWLVIGPYRTVVQGPKGSAANAAANDALTSPPPDVDESTLHASLGAAWGPAFSSKADPPRWTLVSSNGGPVDLKASLHAYAPEVIGYASGVLHLEQPGRYYFLLGVDDGVRLTIDGKAVLAREESRPERDDDDIVPVELAAGDHTLVLKLHQREGAWSMHVRVLDASLAPPVGAYLELPGTTADDARDLAGKLSWISVDRGADATGWHPKVRVRFPEGAPLGVPIGLRVRLLEAPASLLARQAAGSAAATQRLPLFDVAAGQVPFDATGAQDLEVDLPPLSTNDFPKSDEWTYEVRVADRVDRVPVWPRRTVIQALAHADKTLPTLEGSTTVPPASLDSLEFLRARLSRLASHGDGDVDAEIAEARELDGLLDVADKGRDPYGGRFGPQRRAYRSPIDGQLDELGLYVPPGYRRSSGRRYPLIVVLHGLNGRPMAMIRYFFGGDDPNKENEWEDRHPLDPMPPLDAFVVAPSGHGNTMYRDLGEEDVLRAVQWVEDNYSIDKDRVTITGPSMGGIGSAAVPLHHPDVFAAAAPLCGYHSYFVRRDVAGRPMRPWEHLLAEERSNASWADNGERLPLWIVHGTLDQPEANSGVLIKRYEDLHFSIVHDHPELGHNVWQTTYEDMKGAKWLLPFRRNAHPRTIHFRTVRLRQGDDAWLHVDELGSPDTWADVSARVRGHSTIDVTNAEGVSALHFDHDDKLLDSDKPVRVVIGGKTLSFESGQPIAVHLEGDAWTAGTARHDGPFKHGNVTGPIRDAFHEPLVFVYGASDPTQRRANEDVARSWAQIRGGVTVRYPVVSDVEFLEQGGKLDGDRPLFLVGNAKSNRVVAALEPEFPIRIDGDVVVVGGQRLKGPELGAAFIRPNPKRPDRYVVVVEGVDALGTWRSLSLPDLVPDFVVYDRGVAPSRGQVLLGAGSLRAAGFFTNDWALPATFTDPLAAATRPGAKSEHEATPYLP